jgi:hypothetical protein
MSENWFTDENTIGYTAEELDVLNVELAARLAGIDENSPDFLEEVKAFRDEVSRR